MFNLSFFKVWNFSPLSISIALFDKIKKNYSYKSEVDLTSIENSLLIKSLFDIGVLLYVDNNSTEAFSHLQQANELFLLNRLGIKEFDKITNNYQIARKHNSVHYSTSKEQTKEEIITTKTPRQSQICDLNEGKILIRIELMLGEIELDKQNFIEAYQHVKSAIYLLKSFTEGEYITHNTNQEIEKAAHFLAEIEKQYVESIEQSRKTIERIDFNNKLIYTPKMSEDTKQTIEEIEKFFLFLSTLSIYQIKVLNDFQPKQGGNRDYLPIMFPNQFKDCLIKSFRNKLCFTTLNTFNSRTCKFIHLNEPLLRNSWFNCAVTSVTSTNIVVMLFNLNKETTFIKVLNNSVSCFVSIHTGILWIIINNLSVICHYINNR